MNAATPPATSPSAWAPLRHRLFRALWLASLTSNIGTWMQNTAAAWLMTSLSPSPLMVALVQTATSLPYFLLALPAGALADIVDRRRVLVASQLWMVLVAGALAVLTGLGLINAWMLLGLTFALGVGAAFTAPAWQAFTPNLVPRIDLPAAVALNGVSINVARAVGPMSAVGYGLLLGSLGSGAIAGAALLPSLRALHRFHGSNHWRQAPRNPHPCYPCNPWSKIAGLLGKAGEEARANPEDQHQELGVNLERRAHRLSTSLLLVFGVHALGGAWGALASGIFAVTLGSGIESNAQQIMVQLSGIAFVAIFAPIATFVILTALKMVFGSLRVAEEDEVEGLDLSQHSESGYSGLGGGSLVEGMHGAHLAPHVVAVQRQPA